MRLVVPAAYPWREKTRAAASRMRRRVSTARAWSGDFLGLRDDVVMGDGAARSE
jgi:hypothetical protein